MSFTGRESMGSVYDVFLYDVHPDIDPSAVETCGHGHPTLQEAWACARTFDPDHPFDVVSVTDGGIDWACVREDEADAIPPGERR